MHSAVNLPALEQARLLRQGDLSSLQLVQEYLARIESLNGRLNAFITVDSERALANARIADLEIRSNGPRSPLHGLPFSVKDQMDIEGVRVTGGSRVLVNNTATRTATVVKRLVEAGGIVLGTLNTQEFHMNEPYEYPYGTPRNPWNTDRVTGGSSNGSASAVAAGLCSFSLGGDTGGSIRGPASYCGVVGLKPTWSRVSRFGVIPCAWSLDCIGPLGRTVADTATVLSTVAGHDSNDQTSSTRPVPRYVDVLEHGVEGLRVGVVQEMTTSAVVREDARRAVLRAVDVLRGLGATIIEVSLPGIAHSRYLGTALVQSEGASFHRPWLLDRYQDYDYNTRVGLMVGAILPAGLQSLAERVRAAVAAQVVGALDSVDVLVGATRPSGAPPVQEAPVIASKEDAQEHLYGRAIEGALFTRVFSLAGVPAMSVPCGFDTDGMPLGLQIASRQFEEGTMLRVAAAYEREAGWPTAPELVA